MPNRKQLLEHLQVFVPSSLSPWHPNTDITLQTIDSIWSVLGKRVPIRLYCDGLPEWATKQDVERYTNYLTSVSCLPDIYVTKAGVRVGLVGLVDMFIKEATTKLVLNVQHDWLFIEPERVEVDNLLEAMLYHPEIQIVRFHKRSLPQLHRYVDRQYYEVERSKYGVPLIATDGWGDSPHVASLEHYRGLVTSHRRLDCGPDGRYGLEGPIWRAYQRDIRSNGFWPAHSKWGSYLYGKFGDKEYIQHIGGAAKRWRKKIGVESKRK